MLADPGIGLSDRPWKVLTYADMETLGSTPDNPIDSLQADREIVLHLTGNMDRYMWSFNGIKFADSVPLELFHHELVRTCFLYISAAADSSSRVPLARPPTPYITLSTLCYTLSIPPIYQCTLHHSLPSST